MDLKFTRPLKTFFLAASVIAVVMCVWECVLLRQVPEAAAHFRVRRWYLCRARDMRP